MASKKEIINSLKTTKVSASSTVTVTGNSSNTLVTAGNNTNGIIIELLSLNSVTDEARLMIGGNRVLSISGSSGAVAETLKNFEIEAGKEVKLATDSSSERATASYRVK